MLLSNVRLVLFALCSFSIGTWIGYYWRRRLSTPQFVQIHKRLVPPEDRLSEYNKSGKQAFAARLSEYNKSRKQDNVVLRNHFHFQEETSNTKCHPRTDVMFLKTHKTASSAVQNVLLRYANKADLTVGLSNTHDIRFHYGQKFQKDFVAAAERPINILCHHMVFNYPELQKVMPENTSYITILREPSSLFESMFDYLHYDSTPFSRIKKKPSALEYWLNHTNQFFRGRNDGRFWWFAKNGVFFDMGYDNLSDDDKYIEQAIAELDKVFDLVLISDYFAESMLLLKDHLCWSMEDILALKTNARDSANTVLTDRVKKKIYEWNKADAAVYLHFNRTFWNKVAAYGHDRMQADLKILERMNTELQQNCIDGGAVSNKFIKDESNKVYNPRGVVMKGYNLKESSKNNQTCINLLKGEIQWTREMMARNKVKT